MDISKFFTKKRGLSDQSNSDEVDNRLGSPKQNKKKLRPIIIKSVRNNFRRRIL